MTAAADAAAGVARSLGLADGAVEDRFGTATLSVPTACWLAAAGLLRDAGFGVLDWLSAVDSDPLDVVAMFVRQPAPGSGLARVLLRALAVGDDPLDSLTGLWPSAAWHERETAELFGVAFRNFAEDVPEGVVDRPRLLLTAGWPAPAAVPPLRKAATPPARAAKPWPGLAEPVVPADLPTHAHRRRAGGRRPLPPGVPG